MTGISSVNPWITLDSLPINLYFIFPEIRSFPTYHSYHKHFIKIEVVNPVVTDVLRIAHLRIAHQGGNPEGNLVGGIKGIRYTS